MWEFKPLFGGALKFSLNSVIHKYIVSTTLGSVNTLQERQNSNPVEVARERDALSVFYLL